MVNLRRVIILFCFSFRKWWNHSIIKYYDCLLYVHIFLLICVCSGVGYCVHSPHCPPAHSYTRNRSNRRLVLYSAAATVDQSYTLQQQPQTSIILYLSFKPQSYTLPFIKFSSFLYSYYYTASVASLYQGRSLRFSQGGRPRRPSSLLATPLISINPPCFKDKHNNNSILSQA